VCIRKRPSVTVVLHVATGHKRSSVASFDHLVGGDKQGLGHSKPERLNAPSIGRIQKGKTNFSKSIIFGLLRAAGPYRRANHRHCYVCGNRIRRASSRPREGLATTIYECAITAEWEPLPPRGESDRKMIRHLRLCG